MNLKKTALIVTGIAILSTGAVFADQFGDRRGGRGMFHGPAMDPSMMVGRLTRHLDLDEAQEIDIENILEAAKPEFQAIRERGRAARDAMMNLDPASPEYSVQLNNLALESGQIVTETALLAGRVRADVNAVLTPEQTAELKATIERFRERANERRRGRWAERNNNEE